MDKNTQTSRNNLNISYIDIQNAVKRVRCSLANKNVFELKPEIAQNFMF